MDAVLRCNNAMRLTARQLRGECRTAEFELEETFMGFKVVWDDGDEDDEVFETEQEAEAHAANEIDNYHAGAEVLHLSNPGDYDEDDPDDDPGYEVVEVDN
ncbi:hypothetical protein BKA24_001145 [Microbacterium marinum]|uniref:Uncharacterized protein n=1 Tax=Microbacterium marinum TaxID=421115 RepID=A0A7W7BRF0_9MICO|nr:hypothetical protein [Microbacterium marinum]MBB4666436.1 hypothetical protein [Microbacterium marinum]